MKEEAANRPCKGATASMAEQVHVLTMPTLNGNAYLSGAQLMQWVDEVAVVVARRHSGTDVTTVRVDNLQFLLPAINRDTIVVKGALSKVGSTSMLVHVDVYKERFCGEQTKIAQADVLMVSLDEAEHPHIVPRLEE